MDSKPEPAATVTADGNNYGKEPAMNLLNEPVLIGGAIRAVILAAMAFGFTVTPEQLGAVMLAVEAVLALATRAFVTPNHLAEARVDQAIKAGQDVTEKTPTTPRKD